MHTHRGRILIAFAIVYLVWGSTYLGIRVAVETIPPFLLAASRSLFAGAVLYAFARWRAGKREGGSSVHSFAEAQDRLPIRRSALWRTAFIMGFLMFVMGNALLSWAETRIDSGLAALIVGAIPLWVVVMARLNPYGAKREITLQKFVGVVVGIAGLGMLVWPGSATTTGVRMDPLAIGLLMFGSLGWAWGTVISPSLAHSGDKLEGSAMTMLAGGAMILIPAALKGEFSQFHPELVSARSLAAWVYLVVFGSMIAYSAYVYLVASCEASTVATYALVNPIVAVFLGWLFVGEVVTSRMVLATVVIVAGLALTLFGGQAAVWANRQVRATGAAIRSVVL